MPCFVAAPSRSHARAARAASCRARRPGRCAPTTASTGHPFSSACARVVSTTADAPSEICDELPAVIEPPSANGGPQARRASRRSSRGGCPRPRSRATGSPRAAAPRPARSRRRRRPPPARPPHAGATGRPRHPAAARVTSYRSLCRSVDAPMLSLSYASVSPSKAMWSSTSTLPYCPAVARSHQQVRRAGHRLHAGGDHDRRRRRPRIMRAASMIAVSPDRQTLLTECGGHVPCRCPRRSPPGGRGSDPEPAGSTCPTMTASTASGADSGPARARRGSRASRAAARVNDGELALQPALRGAGGGNDDDVVGVVLSCSAGRAHACSLAVRRDRTVSGGSVAAIDLVDA